MASLQKPTYFFNGRQIATKVSQSGSYGGHTYDITCTASNNNAMVIKVYPADYNRDLVQSFNDWNHSPLDHSAGIWRDITLKQTGPIELGPLSITTAFDVFNNSFARISLRALARNLENRTITILPKAHICRAALERKAQEGYFKDVKPQEDRGIVFKNVTFKVDSALNFSYHPATIRGEATRVNYTYAVYCLRHLVAPALG